MGKKIRRQPLKTANSGERDEGGRFVVGNRCGNGRPRNELSITNEQRKMLPMPCPYSKNGQTWLGWLADRGMALAGENATYYRELLDRLEGKVTQPISGAGEFTIKVVYDDA